MLGWGSDLDSRRAVQRLIFRCVCDFLLDEAGAMAARHDGDFIRGVAWLALLQAGAGREAAERGVSIRALSRSLSLPFETTRRKLGDLEAAGFCRRLESGQYIPLAQNPGTTAAEVARTCQAFHDVMERLRRTGVDPAQFLAAPAIPSPDQAAARAATRQLIEGFVLRTLEAGVAPHGSIIDAILFAALVTANADRITNDPVLARRYAGADTPPPDELRRPVRPREIAERLHMPYELIRRRLLVFLGKGWCVRRDSGYLASIARMQEPALLGTALAISQRFAQLTQAIAQAGLDLNVPAGPPGR
jgi:hypothetical protein